MLNLIDESLEGFLRATVPLAAQDVDVSFETPDRDWSAKLSRPTVNIFLWDIRRSVDRSRAGLETVERDGQMVHRLALPRVELRYTMTAWTSDHGDERALLAGLMRTVLAFGEIPGVFLADGLAAVGPLALLMSRGGEDHIDAFKAAEIQLKPAINVTVVTSVDTGVYTPAGPPAAEFEFRLSDRNTGAVDAPLRRVAGEIADPAAVGAAVRSPRGATTVNAAGRFLIAAASGDELVVDTVPPRTVVVPAEGGVRL
jgi:hypothetical protein